MHSSNEINLIGFVGSAPEIRELENGTRVARFRMATSENYQDKDGEWQSVTEWHTCICWRKMADRAEQNLKKGSYILVKGKMTYRQWETESGEKKENAEVVVRSLGLLFKKDFAGNFPNSEDAPPAADPVSKPAPVAGGDTATDGVDDDLPF